MFDPNMELACAVLCALFDDPEAGTAATKTWADACEAIAAMREEEPELAALVDAEDATGLRAMIEEWHTGKRHLPLQDRGVLKRAMKAYRKSLKVTILASESTLGGGPMSGGRQSSITGITPPARYPHEVWQELVRQGRLKDSGRGTYELPPGG